MQTRLDHLVIAAADLSAGAAYVKDRLDIDIPYGGAHKGLGTHNHLMQLGNNVFLEVIALDADSESPERPRWFGLDDPYVRRRIESQPALLTWVVNTDNIARLLQTNEFPFGTSKRVGRGNLEWYFGVPEDGRLLAGGMLPYVIEWQCDTHPSRNMANRECTLRGLEVYHPYPTWLRSVLDSIGAAELVTIRPLPADSVPYLSTFIETPSGIKELRSDAGF